MSARVCAAADHGAYWASLAGRRAVIMAPSSTKFWLMRTPQPPVLNESRLPADMVAEALRRSPLPPKGLLHTTRLANCDFYEKLLAHLCKAAAQKSGSSP